MPIAPMHAMPDEYQDHVRMSTSEASPTRRAEEVKRASSLSSRA